MNLATLMHEDGKSSEAARLRGARLLTNPGRATCPRATDSGYKDDAAHH